CLVGIELRFGNLKDILADLFDLLRAEGSCGFPKRFNLRVGERLPFLDILLDDGQLLLDWIGFWGGVGWLCGRGVAARQEQGGRKYQGRNQSGHERSSRV